MINFPAKSSLTKIKLKLHRNHTKEKHLVILGQHDFYLQNSQMKYLKCQWAENCHLESSLFNKVPKVHVKIMIHIFQVLIKEQKKRERKGIKEKKRKGYFTTSALSKKSGTSHIQSAEAKALSAQDSF